MSKGRKLVYHDAQDWGWLDIESGDAGRWDVKSLGTIGFAQVSDTTIYLDIGQGKPIGGGQLFDIEKGTLTAVKNPLPDLGRLHPAAPRQGFVSHVNGAVIVGNDAVTEGGPQPIEKATADIHLWLQQLKLQNATQQEEERATRPPMVEAQNASAPRQPIASPIRLFPETYRGWGVQ
jgi:hypothetical protein